MATLAGPELGEWRLVGLFRMLSLPHDGCTDAEAGDSSEWGEDDIQRLVNLARQGDRLAQQRLYRAHVDRVFRTVRGMLHSDADAEDVTQDTLLTVLTSLDRYSQRSGVRFVAWVTTIALNTARRRFRRQRPVTTDTGDLFERPDESVDLERDADAARARAALLEAIATLDPLERDIVSLRYGAELNASEIAKLVRLRPDNVRKILERTRSHLREQIESVIEDAGVAR
jgi:RNA polymerase sigma-70 factor (ECF subfamily)